MTVTRIVANIQTPDPELAAAFYEDILGLSIVMDQGWIKTFASPANASPQLNFAAHGGSDAPVPDLSIDVDNFDEVLAAVQARNLTIEYGPVTEPWGVRRFYVKDPFGRMLNILTHA